MKWSLKNVAFSIVVLVTTVLLCELVLQITALLLAKDAAIHFQPVPLQVEDPVLGNRGNPSHLGHDRRGFRNLSVPDRALAAKPLSDRRPDTALGVQRLGPDRPRVRRLSSIVPLHFTLRSSPGRPWSGGHRRPGVGETRAHKGAPSNVLC